MCRCDYDHDCVLGQLWIRQFCLYVMVLVVIKAIIVMFMTVMRNFYVIGWRLCMAIICLKGASVFNMTVMLTFWYRKRLCNGNGRDSYADAVEESNSLSI